jgi:hypothetical protein
MVHGAWLMPDWSLTCSTATSARAVSTPNVSGSGNTRNVEVAKQLARLPPCTTPNAQWISPEQQSDLLDEQKCPLRDVS